MGNGESISISSDPWLPDSTNPYVTTTSEAVQDKSVSWLMVAGEDRWDEELVRSIFDERDVNLILSIPLRRADEDVRFWKQEKLGFYSVKTAYALIQESKMIPISPVPGNVWKELWNLKVPPKVKHLVWRATSGCLPTKPQLCTRKVNISPLCPMCNSEEVETIQHAL